MTPEVSLTTQTSEVVLSPDDRRIIGAMLQPGVSIEIKIPAGADEDELWRTLEACARGLSYMQQRTLLLRPIIGRILLIYQGKPSLYKARGYDNFTEFLRGIRTIHGWGQSLAYEAMKLARQWPDLPPEEYAAIGPKRMAILNRFATGNARDAPVLLEQAKTVSLRDFEQWAISTGRLEPGEATKATLEIFTTKAIAQRVRKFLENHNVHKHVESADWGEILIALIEECHEWADEQPPESDFRPVETVLMKEDSESENQ